MKIKRYFQMMVVIVTVFFLSAAIAEALPSDWKVEEGAVQVEVKDSSMTITSGDTSTIINFDSFNVLENECVYFRLPTAESRILSRAVGGSRSDIFGGIDCNGNLYLVNEAGFHIGENARINANNLVISTRDISNTDFINGNYVFDKLSDERLHALLLNEGRITINRGGFGVLIAEGINNKGVIIAPAGKIILAGASAVRLDIAADGRISVAISEKAARTIMDADGNPITDQIFNTGKLEAEGGEVILKAESLPAVFEKAMKLEGEIKATRMVNGEGGLVRMVADGDIELGCSIDARLIEVESWGCVTVTGTIVSSGGNIDISAPTLVVEASSRERPDAITGSPRCIRENSMPDRGAGLIAGELAVKTEPAETVIFEDDFINIPEERPVQTRDLIAGGARIENERGTAAAVPTTITPGKTVKFTAQRTGSSEDLAGVSANLTYINILQKDIELSEMWGIGSCIFIRGPAPQSNCSDIAVDFEKPVVSVSDSTGFLLNEAATYGATANVSCWPNLTLDNFSSLVLSKNCQGFNLHDNLRFLSVA